MNNSATAFAAYNRAVMRGDNPHPGWPKPCVDCGEMLCFAANHGKTEALCFDCSVREVDGPKKRKLAIEPQELPGNKNSTAIPGQGCDLGFHRDNDTEFDPYVRNNGTDGKCFYPRCELPHCHPVAHDWPWGMVGQVWIQPRDREIARLNDSIKLLEAKNLALKLAHDRLVEEIQRLIGESNETARKCDVLLAKVQLIEAGFRIPE